MADKSSFFDLPPTIRKLVRTMRHHFLSIYRRKKFDRHESETQLLAMANKLLQRENLSKISTEQKAQLVNIILFDESPRQRQKPLIWEHEFSAEEYPNVNDPADIVFRIALQLDSQYLLLYLDSLFSLDKNLAQTLFEKLQDSSFLKVMPIRDLQELFRHIDSKILSDALKVLDVSYEPLVLDNVSKSISRQIMGDKEHHESLASSKAKLACVEITRTAYRLSFSGKIKLSAEN